jgi:Spy/CpxP family protein refolding chaperone
MKRAWTWIVVTTLLAAMVINPAFAQGRGAGRGNAYGAKGQPCPYGYTQPNPNAGGWWTRVNPTEPQEKQFVEQVKALHDQIRQKQFELTQMQANKADAKAIEAKQAEINALREQLHQLQVSNRELHQKMMQQNRGGSGYGGAGNGYGNRARAQMRGTNPNCPFVNTR